MMVRSFLFITGPLRIKKSSSFNVIGEVTKEIRADVESCLVDCLR